MTEEEKAKRREYIQAQVEADTSKGRREMTYWLTRDRDMTGRLEPYVDVWLKRPTLCVLPGGVGVTWICDDLVEVEEGTCPARYTQWSPDQCLRACRVYPETERECIRVGE